ncbi:hypothetical protein HDU89_004999 [Geranomyces variabilis]|nr:hypothetical protein HDU89_004999 [Geranomyces variabilis]
MPYAQQSITANPDGSLTVNDCVYGDPVTIEESVLVHLIQTKAVQRLRHVLQHGITGVLGMTPPVTRLEHSVGAMLLVRRLGAGIKEQIAALLHDVSHTAFSHVVDHAFRGTDSYHELNKEAFVRSSDLPETLAAFGYDWHDFLEEKDYPLLEQPSPALCADRVDYGLRDCLAFCTLTSEQVAQIVGNLTVVDKCIVCRDAYIARIFAEGYMATDRKVWSNPEHIALYELTGAAIRDAIARGSITEEHLWLRDEEFWTILKSNSRESDKLALVCPRTKFVPATGDADADLSFFVKARTVDPGVQEGEQGVALSTIDSDYKCIREAYLESKGEMVHLHIIA